MALGDILSVLPVQAIKDQDGIKEGETRTNRSIAVNLPTVPDTACSFQLTLLLASGFCTITLNTEPGHPQPVVGMAVHLQRHLFGLQSNY